MVFNQSVNEKIKQIHQVERKTNAIKFREFNQNNFDNEVASVLS